MCVHQYVNNFVCACNYVCGYSWIYAFVYVCMCALNI